MSTGIKGDFKETIFNEINENVKVLESLFPAVVKDGQVDFQALKEILGNFEEVGQEKYELTWSGKKNAKKVSQEDIIAKTLKYVPEESKNPETTENLYIEGDNLEVLKLLRQNYYGSIKMIYIDPPYNTGNDFVYNDNFSMDKIDSDIGEGDVSDLGERYTVNSKSTNKYHANWLNMMYPRLRIAKDLLKDDGVIFISIDDNEVYNLKKICDEICGENNFIGCITREAIKGGSISKNIRLVTDYVLVYSKNIDLTNFYGIEVDGTQLNLQDEKGKYAKGRELNKWGVGSRREDSPGMWFPIKGPNGVDVYPIRNDGSEGRWRLGKEKLHYLVENGNAIFEQRKNGTYIVYEKIRDDSKRIKQYTNLFKDEYMNSKGTEELKKIFVNDRAIFDYSKPSNLIADLVRMSNVNDGEIVLDFFSGSATTAHAVIKLNSLNNGKRKFIMVQIPENTDEKSEAKKANFTNICNIGKERIRRAGEKIKVDNKDKEGIDDLDIGFKVFKVSDTNIRWIRENENLQTLANEVISKENEQQTTFNYIAATSSSQVELDERVSLKDRLDFMPGFKDIDVIYELLLRQRDVPLSAKVRQLEEIGARTYLFDESFLVCLEEDITNELVEKLASLNPLPIKFILRDTAFGDDINLKDETNRRLKTLIEKNTGETKKTYTVEYI